MDNGVSSDEVTLLCAGYNGKQKKGNITSTHTVYLYNLNKVHRVVVQSGSGEQIS